MSDENLPAVVVPTPQLTAEQVKGQIQLIQRVTKGVMKKDMHFGKIPGTQKNTLYKAGSEVLLTTFRIGVELQVEDLSTTDCIRYRVTVTGRHQLSGIALGQGIGEASTNEEKYRWRRAVCDKEYELAPEDRKRIKFQKYGQTVEELKQVRTEPADVANTILKMAKKRAQIDMTLTALACSDMFTQDLEDMPAELRDQAAAEEGARPTQAKPATEAPRAAPQPSSGPPKATEKQVKLLHARLDNSGIPENAFLREFGVESIAALPFSQVDEALAWIAKNAP